MPGPPPTTAATRITCEGVGSIDLDEPVRLIEKKKKRAIVENEAVGEEGDIGQDMGSHSLEMTFEGLATKAAVALLESFADYPQFTVAYPAGRCSILQVDDNGYYQINLNKLCIVDLTTRYQGGFPQRWHFFLTVRRHDQT